MIDTIILQNLTTKNTLEMGKSFGHKYIIEDNGIDWGDVEAVHNRYTNLTGIGNIITSTKLDTRRVSITGRVCPTHTIKQISQMYDVYTAKEIEEKRFEEIKDAEKPLSQLINPLHYIRIRLGNYYIDGKPTTSIQYSHKEKENNEIYCKFTFTLDCSDPMFHFKTVLETQLSGLVGGFHFPVIIPKNEGMHFGNLIRYQLIAVQNMGDVDIGALIRIVAKGEVVNPRISSVYGEEEIVVNKTLHAGEIVEIDTNERTIVGYHSQGSAGENDFSYWDFDNSWIQFTVGANLIGYSADDDTQNAMDITIRTNPSFFAVEGQ